jgi:hypothetical protein
MNQELPEELNQQVLSLIAKDKKLQALKVVREHTNREKQKISWITWRAWCPRSTPRRKSLTATIGLGNILSCFLAASFKRG